MKDRSKISGGAVKKEGRGLRPGSYEKEKMLYKMV